jgi:ribosome maturation factor RimP
MLDSIHKQLENKIQEIVQELGLELFDFKIFSQATVYNVRCLIDHPEGGITVEECAGVNEKIVTVLSESKILGDSFTVEVNSPGLDRLLKSYKDFKRVQDKFICLWLNEPLENKQYLEGKLIDLAADFLFLKGKDKIYQIELSKVKTGKVRVEI